MPGIVILSRLMAKKVIGTTVRCAVVILLNRHDVVKSIFHIFADIHSPGCSQAWSWKLLLAASSQVQSGAELVLRITHGGLSPK